MGFLVVTSEKTIDYPTMTRPAIYRIRVRGRLDPGLSPRLEGMQVENLSRSDGTVESVLEGHLLDQAALAGILSKLYDLHLPVMSVDCLGSSDGA